MLSSHITSLLAFVVILCLPDGSQSQNTTSVTPSPSVTTSTDTVTISNVQQTTTTAAQSEPPPSQTSSTDGAAINPSSTSTASSVSSTQSTPSKTFVEFTCLVKTAWNANYSNNYTDEHRNLSTSIQQALVELYSSSMYGIKALQYMVFTQEGEHVKMKAAVTFTGITAKSLEDVFEAKWKTGKLSLVPLLEVSNCMAEAKGVELGDWKAKSGECSKKCSDSDTSTGQEFHLERTCTKKQYGCGGLKIEDETKECDEYCDSSSAVFQVSFTVLVMALVASLSQML